MTPERIKEDFLVGPILSNIRNQVMVYMLKGHTLIVRLELYPWYSVKMLGWHRSFCIIDINFHECDFFFDILIKSGSSEIKFTSQRMI